MDEETIRDDLLEEGESDEGEIEDEMDRADMLLDLGYSGEWREWGDSDELDDLDI